QPGEARAHVLEAHAIAEELGDGRLEVRTLFELAEIDRDFRGEVDVAVETLERALELAAALGDRRLLAEGNLRLGFVLSAAGRLADAERALVRSAEIGAELDSRRDQSRATFLRGWIARQRGRTDEAERLALEAQEWFQRTGDRYFLVQNLRALAECAIVRGDHADAVRKLDEALLVEDSQAGWLYSSLSGDLARVLVTAGRLDEARARATAAMETAPEDDPAARAGALMAAACVAGAAGERDSVLTQSAEALELYEGLRSALSLAEAQIALARALANVGERGEASRLLSLAVAETSRIGAVTLEKAAQDALSTLG